MKREKKITIDKDKNCGYEYKGPIFSIFHGLILTPIFIVVPWKILSLILLKSSRASKEVKINATTHGALEPIYTYSKLNLSNGIKDGLFTYFWQHGTINAKALRNRLELVKKMLRDTIKIVGTNGKKIKILSLASGSARAVIEIIDNCNNFDIILLDRNEKAISYSKALAKDKKVNQCISWKHDKIRNFKKYCKRWQPDIIEMVGFLDYVEDKWAVDLFNKIYDSLSKGGVFITGNIRRNIEKKFVEHAVGWDMVYRDVSDLHKLIMESNFDVDKCRIVYEPIEIHGILICKK